MAKALCGHDEDRLMYDTVGLPYCRDCDEEDAQRECDEHEQAKFALRRIINRLAQVFSLMVDTSAEECVRAGGDVVCNACGDAYHKHASDPREPWMTLLCGGRRVKL